MSTHMYTPPFLPFASPDIGEEEILEVTRALRSGWLTTGPLTFQFEEEFRNACGAQAALAVNSCTAGLHLALTALDLHPGDEVITTPLTFCSTVNVILHAGATPILADVGPDLEIDPEHVERAITPRTRAIIPVHLAGLPCDLGAIWALARQNGLKVIEDAAHAAGAKYRNVPIGGGTSDAVVFSFYAIKNLTTGEGGMITSPVGPMQERMRRLCLHGISKDAWRRYRKDGNWFYEVVDCGFKYNMSDIMAAIGIHQLRRLESMTQRRTAIARQYRDAFNDMPEFELPPDRMDCRHCWHLFILRLNLSHIPLDRAQFCDAMQDLGIGCSVHFIPIPLHPYYRDRFDSGAQCPHAISEYPRLVSLPLYSKMTDGDVSRVIAAVKSVVSRARQRRRVFAAAGGASV